MSSIDQTQTIPPPDLEKILRDREVDLDRRRRELPQFPRTQEEIEAASVFKILEEDYQEKTAWLAERRAYAWSGSQSRFAAPPVIAHESSDQTSSGSHVRVREGALSAHIQRPSSASDSFVARRLRTQEFSPLSEKDRPCSVPPRDVRFMQQSAPPPDNDPVTPSAPPPGVLGSMGIGDSLPPPPPARATGDPPFDPSAPPVGVLGSLSDATS